MANEERAKEMLQHLILLIHESMQSVRPASLVQDDLFEQGRALAYYEVGELVLESARVFNLSLEELDVKGFNPGSLL
ncbi:hypothetical protein [Chitinophaga sp. sic0106]|uniref:hypothetical protein n=1 Tax=Chitinophaga sp. sic0106 TaxID=2854785 RepID=UPI001C47C9C9|nr:hypothetical protein [Chitinophaga sp. sic0106]MBV7529418.1 hypothetical protein [Chitinophaga sp. sic0106]